MTTVNPVARAIVDRRLEIGYDTQQDAASAADIGTTTWGLMEAKGQLPKSRTVRQKVSRALQWPSNALDNLAAGRPVDAINSATLESHPDLLRRVEALSEEVARSHQQLSGRLDSIAEQMERLLREQEESQRAQ